MKHLVFDQKENYKFAFLVPKISKTEIEKYYLQNFNKEEVLVLDLYQDPYKKKTSRADMNSYIKDELLPVLDDFNCKFVAVCDPEYFKAFTKVTKTEPYVGYGLDSVFGSFKVFLVPNYKAVFYDPEKTINRINLGTKAMLDMAKGTYIEPGKNIIHKESYSSSEEDIKKWLSVLEKQNRPLTCDIETFSLKFYEAGISTITFCWNQHEGVCFEIDGHIKDSGSSKKELLKEFFIKFNNKLIFHNIAFDVTVLTYELFMKNLTDYEGMRNGLDILLKNWDDTKLITYLATNSCSGNNLSLKYQAQEFAGNYAQEDINDVTKIPMDQLLRYNLVDGLSTWYVYNKYYNKMIEDQQLNIYETLFKPSTRDIIEMQLVGMPMSQKAIQDAKKKLYEDQENSLKVILNNEFVYGLTEKLNKEWVDKRNAVLKKKKVSIEDANESFNPNSDPQVRRLIYEELKLPIINLTDNKMPSTDSDTLSSLIEHTSDPEIKKLLQAFVDYIAVNKIITSFIPAFEKAVPIGGDELRLYGNFNLGGTISGRMSSNNPNLQQIPATGSKYAKLIKMCFSPQNSMLFCGLDFASLEDRISALTTKDENKLKVYLEHYDGHCLRAYSYFKDQMPDITEEIKNNPQDEVNIINSIKHRYKHLRQDSKSPTFALTYAGNYKTLMTKFGFSEEKAKGIESAYHSLYKTSDEWVKKKLDQAAIDGYVTCAFGLRVRTPLLHQVIRGNSKTPYEAEAEGRSAGNALGQSYCLLNNRAGIEFNEAVRKSKYRLDILPVAMIHDAQYFLIRNDPDVVAWANKMLVKAVQWQDDPAIYHPEVKLGGEFSIFYPDWAHELTVPNECTKEQLIELVHNYEKELYD